LGPSVDDTPHTNVFPGHSHHPARRKAMRKTIHLIGALALCLFVATAFSACSKELDAQETENPKESGLAKSVEVEVYNNEFHPATVTIAVGGTVTFRNRDLIQYSVTTDGMFDVTLDTKQTHTATFPNAGTYRVYDRLNANAPQMTVVVK